MKIYINNSPRTLTVDTYHRELHIYVEVDDHSYMSGSIDKPPSLKHPEYLNNCGISLEHITDLDLKIAPKEYIPSWVSINPTQILYVPALHLRESVYTEGNYFSMELSLLANYDSLVYITPTGGILYTAHLQEVVNHNPGKLGGFRWRRSTPHYFLWDKGVIAHLGPPNFQTLSLQMSSKGVKNSNAVPTQSYVFSYRPPPGDYFVSLMDEIVLAWGIVTEQVKMGLTR